MFFQTIYNYAIITPFKNENMKTITYKKYKATNSTQYIVRLFGVPIWASLHAKTFGWFRLFGIGLEWSHEKWGLSFSQRNGYRKYVKIGKWVYGFLK